MARPAETPPVLHHPPTFHCRNGTLGSGNPCCCSDMINGYRKCRLVIVGILFSHLWDFQLSDIGLRHWHTDQAPAMGRHKINIGCGGKFRSTDKVPPHFRVPDHPSPILFFPFLSSSRASSTVSNSNILFASLNCSRNRDVTNIPP